MHQEGLAYQWINNYQNLEGDFVMGSFILSFRRCSSKPQLQLQRVSEPTIMRGNITIRTLKTLLLLPLTMFLRERVLSGIFSPQNLSCIHVNSPLTPRLPLTYFHRPLGHQKLLIFLGMTSKMVRVSMFTITHSKSPHSYSHTPLLREMPSQRCEG